MLLRVRRWKNNFKAGLRTFRTPSRQVASSQEAIEQPSTPVTIIPADHSPELRVRTSQDRETQVLPHLPHSDLNVCNHGRKRITTHGSKLHSHNSDVPRYPDRTAFEVTADPQAQCLLLTRLPPELRRLVYSFMWRTAGHQALHVERHSSRSLIFSHEPTYLESCSWGSYPCVLPDDYIFNDERLNQELNLRWSRHTREGKVKRDLFGRPGIPVKWSDLGISVDHTVYHAHRNCSSRPLSSPEGSKYHIPDWAPFLPALLTCKKLYVEAVDTIFETLPLHFMFRRVGDMHAFLAMDPHPSLAYLREIHLSDESATDIDWDISHFYKDPVHICLWQAIANMPRLQRVVITLSQNSIWDPGLVTPWILDPESVFGKGAAPKITLRIPTESWDTCKRCGSGRAFDALPCVSREVSMHRRAKDGVTRNGNSSTGYQKEDDDTVKYGRVVEYGLLEYYSDEDRWPPERTHLIKRDPTDMCWQCTLITKFKRDFDDFGV